MFMTSAPDQRNCHIKAKMFHYIFLLLTRCTGSFGRHGQELELPILPLHHFRFRHLWSEVDPRDEHEERKNRGCFHCTGYYLDLAVILFVALCHVIHWNQSDWKCASISFTYFRSFKKAQFYCKLKWKRLAFVSGARIQTHDLLIW